MSKKTRVLIIGGGFGGVYTAMRLEKLLKKDPSVEVGLINKENYLVFQPMLPEVISGSIGLLDVITPDPLPGKSTWDKVVDGATHVTLIGATQNPRKIQVIDTDARYITLLDGLTIDFRTLNESYDAITIPVAGDGQEID
jgi:NADH dehydrogenase FAD-containing subunit